MTAENTAYVADLKGYSGPVDLVSPYHFYLQTCTARRNFWRKKLYDWTRTDPCDARVDVTPEWITAGARREVVFTVTAGRTPLRAGARVAVFFPLAFGSFQEGRNLICYRGDDGVEGYGSLITAESATANVKLETIVHSNGTAFTCVETRLSEGELQEGESVRIIVGHPTSKPQIASEKAKHYTFRVGIDYSGDYSFAPVVPYPVIEVVGAKADRFRCYASTALSNPGEVSLRVTACDSLNHNASHGYVGRARISSVDDDGRARPIGTVDLQAEDRGTTELSGLTVPRDSVTRIQVCDERNGIIGMANPVCPSALPNGYNLYFGEIHSHTELSDGVGTPEDALRWARDVEGLDFAATTDHYEDGQSFNYTIDDKWRITKEAAARFNEPGRFVTLMGYEIGTLEEHRNVYFPDDGGPMIVEGPDGERVTMHNVYDKLKGDDYVLIPHAPMFHGISWHSSHEPERQRLVEICSLWGVSEEGGYQSVRNALDLGYAFGFTGGTDTHTSEPGNPDQGGVTGVYAESLTRRDVFSALSARRTFAVYGNRMFLMFSVNGEIMGSDVSMGASEARRVDGRVLASEPVERVDIIRNGTVVWSEDGNGRTDISIAWEDHSDLSALLLERELTADRYAYYYLRAKTVYGGIAWASPVFVHARG